MSAFARKLEVWFLVQREELGPLLLSFFYFFFLIGSYMMLRPVRETLAVRSGEAEWLFSSVFFVMLLIAPAFGFLVARLRKRVFLPLSYVVFVASLGGFCVWLTGVPDSVWAGRVFFVWLSVYNLFVVSVFWSVMVDVFSAEQGKRLFALIAAGGSAGGILGPLLSIRLVDEVGPGGLIGIAAVLLLAALVCQVALLPRIDRDSLGESTPIGGSIWAGAKSLLERPYLRGIAAVLVFLPLLQTMLYFIQLELVGNAFASDAARLKWFGAVDLGTQVTSWVLQLFITSRLLRAIGPAWTLLIVPLGTALGLTALAVAPGVLVLGVFQALRRGGEYGLMKPARELLFTPVDQEAKYKAKNFIDTAVYRGGDMASGWIYRGFSDVLGLGVAAVAAVSIPVAAVWAAVAFRMGQAFENRTTDREGTGQ